MEDHWYPGGFTVPSPTTYPQQFLWDSCFHSLIWAELGDRRAVTELESLFSRQHESGLVPHMGYAEHPETSEELWGVRGSSCITQPPMFGHALAELVRRGWDVPGDLLESAVSGLAYLLRTRRDPETGLCQIWHPWESGMDDSPRWDAWAPAERSEEAWMEAKVRLVRSLPRGPAGFPSGPGDFAVPSVGFSSLVAFNALELDSVGVDSLSDDVHALSRALEPRFDADLGLWTDPTPGSPQSGRSLTLDGLLPLLVLDDPPVGLGAVLSPREFGGPFGPSYVHREDPAFAAGVYWRGDVWPPLTYLLALAARRRGWRDEADTLVRQLVAGAEVSGLAEHWHPDTGEGLGAVPLCWAGLAIVRFPPE